MSTKLRTHIAGKFKARDMLPGDVIELSQWQEYSRHIRGIADRIKKMQDDRAWALAASVGIPRCGCSLHNASIDTSMTGWCYGNRQRLRTAKAAARILNDWRASRLADAIISRKYRELLGEGS